MNSVSKSFWDYFDNISKLLAGLAFLFWMLQEFIQPNNNNLLFTAIEFGLIDIFYLIFHKFLAHNRGFIISGWAICAVMSYILFKTFVRSTPDGPVVSPAKIQLHDGNGGAQTIIDVFNPKDFPLYCVSIELDIEGVGVKSESLDIHDAEKPDSLFEISVGQGTANYDFIRIDGNKTNGIQITLIQLFAVEGKTHRRFRVFGTIPEKSFATLSIAAFQSNSQPVFSGGRGLSIPIKIASPIEIHGVHFFLKKNPN